MELSLMYEIIIGTEVKGKTADKYDWKKVHTWYSYHSNTENRRGATVEANKYKSNNCN